MPGLKLTKAGTRFAAMAAALIVIAATWFAFGQLWPTYDLAFTSPSPDGRHVIAVIRGDKIGFDDFFYKVYVFPKSSIPSNLRPGERVWMRGAWSDESYLAYIGYSVPSLRWTSGHEIEIDLDETYYQVAKFNPTPMLHEPWGDHSSAILVSLVLNRSDAHNLTP